MPCANRSGTLPKASFKKKIAGVTKGSPKKVKVRHNNYKNHVEG